VVSRPSLAPLVSFSPQAFADVAAAWPAADAFAPEAECAAADVRWAEESKNVRPDDSAQGYCFPDDSWAEDSPWEEPQTDERFARAVQGDDSPAVVDLVVDDSAPDDCWVEPRADCYFGRVALPNDYWATADCWDDSVEPEVSQDARSPLVDCSVDSQVDCRAGCRALPP
jgi:hypothetical protein